jgi:hypothetical protein
VADERIVHEFRKGAGEIVRATIGEYRGRRTIGIRIFYEDVSGEWKPTKKGITLTSDLFPELKKAIDLIDSGLKEEAEEPEPAPTSSATEEAEPAPAPEAQSP